MSRSTSDGCACLALALTARFTIYGSCKPYQKVQQARTKNVGVGRGKRVPHQSVRTVCSWPSFLRPHPLVPNLPARRLVPY
jgi:hypothetical protein